MKKQCIQWVVVALVIMTSVSCEQDSLLQTKTRGNPNPALVNVASGSLLPLLNDPKITSFSPARGIPGATIITIAGKFFSNTPSNNTVTFSGGVQGMIIETNSTVVTSPDYAEVLRVKVPVGALLGKITIRANHNSPPISNNNAAISTVDFVPINIPTNGLAAFYPFDGSANDIGPYQLKSQVNGAVLSQDRLGNANSAYFFDGVNDFITLGNPEPLQISNIITISGWVNWEFRTPPRPLNDNMFIITKRLQNSGGNLISGYHLGLTSDGGNPYYTSAWIQSPPSNYFFGAVGNITAQNWVFFSLVIDGNTMKFYHNGLLTYEVTYANIVLDGSSTLGELVIGAMGGDNQNYGFFFKGKIDDIAIYNRALSSSEVVQLYKQ
jgi:hypothetical protein